MASNSTHDPPQFLRAGNPGTNSRAPIQTLSRGCNRGAEGIPSISPAWASERFSTFLRMCFFPLPAVSRGVSLRGLCPPSMLQSRAGRGHPFRCGCRARCGCCGFSRSLRGPGRLCARALGSCEGSLSPPWGAAQGAGLGAGLCGGEVHECRGCRGPVGGIRRSYRSPHWLTGGLLMACAHGQWDLPPFPPFCAEPGLLFSRRPPSGPRSSRLRALDAERDAGLRGGVRLGWGGRRSAPPLSVRERKGGHRVS